MPLVTGRLIQLQEGYVDEPDIDKKRAIELYDHFAEETLQLMGDVVYLPDSANTQQPKKTTKK